MSDIPKDHISDWLKKLERESWQLELLVSAFTIFLLIMAVSAFDEYLVDIQYQYNLSGGGLSLIYIFLALVRQSLMALTFCLIGHLMLRGFWIGTIGLRSVQATIDFNRLNYNEFFTEKLKTRVISLDRLVIKLDEVCSVIFAFAFLVISMLIAFGMFLVVMGVMAIVLNTSIEVAPTGVKGVVEFVAAGVFFTLLSSGLIFMIDYVTHGFFKKVKWLRKIYYPFYRFYSFITFASLSRSIYYYLISKFTKKKIRIVYGIIATLVLTFLLLSFDQYQFFPDSGNQRYLTADYYEEDRAEDGYVNEISIPSRFIDRPHFQIFIRYDPRDNALIQAHCPDFQPMKDEGLNWRFTARAEGGNLNVSGNSYSNEDAEKLLSCQQAMYQIAVNDSIYQDLSYHFYVHPAHDQKGLLVTIPTDAFIDGENLLVIQKVRKIDNEDQTSDFVRVPFWYRSK